MHVHMCAYVLPFVGLSPRLSVGGWTSSPRTITPPWPSLCWMLWMATRPKCSGSIFLVCRISHAPFTICRFAVLASASCKNSYTSFVAVVNCPLFCSFLFSRHNTLPSLGRKKNNTLGGLFGWFVGGGGEFLSWAVSQVAGDTVNAWERNGKTSLGCPPPNEWRKVCNFRIVIAAGTPR